MIVNLQEIVTINYSTPIQIQKLFHHRLKVY